MQMFNSVVSLPHASRHCPCLGSLVGTEGFGDKSPVRYIPNLARREHSCVPGTSSVPHSGPRPGSGSPEETQRDREQPRAVGQLCTPLPWLKGHFTRPLLPGLPLPPVPLLKEGNQTLGMGLEGWEGAS